MFDGTEQSLKAFLSITKYSDIQRPSTVDTARVRTIREKPTILETKRYKWHASC
jgi:hypothetical protein